MRLDAKNTLPADGTIGALAARAWRPDVDGPSIVALRGQDVIDITRVFPTMRDLCETPDPATALQLARGERDPDGVSGRDRQCHARSGAGRARRRAARQHPA